MVNNIQLSPSAPPPSERPKSVPVNKADYARILLATIGIALAIFGLASGTLPVAEIVLTSITLGIMVGVFVISAIHLIKSSFK